jgi:predicted GIY-YIG superfamily endonuclease
MTDNYTKKITDTRSGLHISEVTVNVKVRVFTHQKKYCKYKLTYNSLDIFIYAEIPTKKHGLLGRVSSETVNL